MIRMRTTLDLPEGLVDGARTFAGFKSKADTVVYALKEVVTIEGGLRRTQ